MLLYNRQCVEELSTLLTCKMMGASCLKEEQGGPAESDMSGANAMAQCTNCWPMAANGVRVCTGWGCACVGTGMDRWWQVGTHRLANSRRGQQWALCRAPDDLAIHHASTAGPGSGAEEGSAHYEAAPRVTSVANGIWGAANDTGK